MKVHKPKLLSFNSSWDLSTLSGPNEPNDKVETLAQKNPVWKGKKKWKPLEKKFEFTINFVTCQEWEKSLAKEIVEKLDVEIEAEVEKQTKLKINQMTQTPS